MRASRLAMMSVAGLLSLGLLGTPAAHAQAQPLVLGPPAAGKIQRLSLTDGTQLIGKIVAVTDSTVDFESNLGRTTIMRSIIVGVREESPGTMRDGKYFFPNPNVTRLYFAPTGRMLEKGEGYFSDHWLFFPSINLGISNNFTFGGGLSVIPGVSPVDQVWYITPKFGVVRGPDFNFAIGALAGAVPSDERGNTAGIVYGVGTWGKPDASFTAGLGYGFVNGEIAERPVLMLGGESRGSPRVSFVTENWVFPGDGVLWSGGMRFFGPGVSVDFAAVGLTGGGEGFCCFPWLGVLWKW